MSDVIDRFNFEYYEVTDKNPIYIKLDMINNKRLYHYTALEAGKNILKNSCFWVTRSDYLYDKSEIIYICKILDGVIAYLKENKALYDLKVEGQFEILNMIIKTIEGTKRTYIENGHTIKNGHIYLLSLTSNKYNNYLMNNYAGSDGITIEVKNNFEKLRRINNFDSNIITMCCAKVEYDYAKQLKLILEDINDFYVELIGNILNKNKPVDQREILEVIKAIINIKILNYSLFFKHYKFAKEEEYRIAFIGDDKYWDSIVKYRDRDGEKIPYIEVKFPTKSLRKIKRG